MKLKKGTIAFEQYQCIRMAQCEIFILYWP